MSILIEKARLDDAADVAALNNIYAPDGLTLARTATFVAERIDGYRVARAGDRDARSRIVACVAVDEYAPSLGELVSLAVAPDMHGRGLGTRLIAAAESLARARGYDELFAISLADTLFLGVGWEETSIVRYPEKQARYRGISRSELKIGKKFCFTRTL